MSIYMWIAQITACNIHVLVHPFDELIIDLYGYALIHPYYWSGIPLFSSVNLYSCVSFNG
jgi:hypothetical protein